MSHQTLLNDPEWRENQAIEAERAAERDPDNAAWYREYAKGLREYQPEPVVVLVLPGGGWLVEHSVHEDSETTWYVEPVVAWAVDSEGHGFPLVTSNIGELAPLNDGDVRLVHPDLRTLPHPYSAPTQS